MSKTIPPPSDPSDDAAVKLIRAKVERALGSEPDASEELAEVKNEAAPSKHQLYVQELSSSGKSLAEIQTAWHHYYTTLTDTEKHEVWQEFYQANQHTPYQKLFQKQQPVYIRKHEDSPAIAAAQPMVTPSGAVVATHEAEKPKHRSSKPRKHKPKAAPELNAKGKLTLKHHLQSLAFGLTTGFIVLVLFLFTFLNQYIIAPFIQPGRTVSSTPIILGDSTVSADTPPSVTVPKINIQIPVDFSVPTTDESQIELGLKHGVVHYPNTVLPGQNGNAAYFGHSSGNIFNNEKYFFSFTLLHDLTTGDVFYVTYNGKNYAYRVFDRQIVPPSDVGVINDTRGKQATAELITCDPPGISTNRLVVWGEQISPDIATNTSPAAPTVAAPTAIAGNGPSLWSKFVGKLEFWN